MKGLDLFLILYFCSSVHWQNDGIGNKKKILDQLAKVLSPFLGRISVKLSTTLCGFIDHSFDNDKHNFISVAFHYVLFLS